MLNEFKTFAMKGNVIELAIAVVIGGAFGRIVTSFVNDIIMPPIGYLTGGVDFSNLTIVLRDATEKTEAVTIGYGAFINTIISFLIIAFSIFMVVKMLNKLKKKEEKKPSEPPKPSEEVVLLTEIRDTLQK